ncbi:MBL fold metallo-hydrolase [Marinicrinis sediminis]|uniref:MBL fold metallo-hydrolase n=1 Tax=Marinicrinis sediminis TaxID=1652465 RepID=A0ABW5R706_9BACL
MTKNTITRHGEWIQIKSPVHFPLQWVNSYLFPEEEGYTLVDPGLHTEQNIQHWQETLSELGIRMTQIRRIVLTHHHPDHYGLSGWMQQQSGAEVWMSETAWKQTQFMWGEQETVSTDLPKLFARHGYPDDLQPDMHKHIQGFIMKTVPHPEVKFFKLDAPFILGGRCYEMIESHGHASGHISFYDADRGVIFCGDQVLPRISPNISYLPGQDPDPLQSYLSSLEQMATLSVVQAYPGHREPFQHFQSRAQELIKHHEVRLAHIHRLAVESDITAYDICQQTFGDRLTVHQMRFAMSEMIAHLVYLAKKGQLQVQETDGLLRYRAAN